MHSEQDSKVNSDNIYDPQRSVHKVYRTNRITHSTLKLRSITKHNDIWWGGRAAMRSPAVNYIMLQLANI
jgi:hypothetical protein